MANVDSAIKAMANILKMYKIDANCSFEDEPTITVDIKHFEAAINIFKKSGFAMIKPSVGSKLLGTYLKDNIEVFLDHHQNFGYFAFKQQDWTWI